MSSMKTISTVALAAVAILTACGGGGNNAGNNAGDNAGNNANLSGNSTPVAPTTNTPAGNSTGTSTSNTPAGKPAPVSEAPVSTASYAYILQAAANAASMSAGTVYTGGSILKCAVDTEGMLTGCSSSGMPAFNNPLSLAFSGSNAYIINQTAPDLEGGVGHGGQYPVLKCAVQADGTLSGCADTYPGSSIETEFAFKLIANANSGYALKETQLLKCPSDFASKCGTDPGGVVLPSNVIASDMVIADNRLYVVNTGLGTNAGSILAWAVDPLTGVLSASPSTVTDASFATALRYGDSSVDIPAELAIKGPNAYILTRYANKVVQCSYDGAANSMTACSATTPLAALAGITPKNIAIEGSYAYITDSSPTATGNSIVKCTVGSADGRLASCALVPGLAFTTEIVDIVFR